MTAVKEFKTWETDDTLKPLSIKYILSSIDLNYLYYDFDRKWWRLFQNDVMITKLDIYFFIERVGIEAIMFFIIVKKIPPPRNGV
jgi:hypothetical protein